MIALAIALLSLTMEAAPKQPKCGEVTRGCLSFTLPEFTCKPAPPGGCINQPCDYIAPCPPKGPGPQPRPEPMLAEVSE